MFTWSRSGRLAALLMIGPLALTVDAVGQSSREVAQRSLPSVVLLVMEDSKGQPFSMGSAFFVQQDVVATNVHVVEGAAAGYARPVGIRSKLDVAGIVALDRQHDLVLLKLRNANGSALRVVDDGKVEIGDAVYAVGNPEGLQGTFSQGIVSGVRETDAGRLLQITAPISPGSSGGPILNLSGEVVGVAVSTYREGQNLNFAVPSGYLLKMLGAVGPLTELTTVPRNQAAKSVTGETGDRAVEGVAALNFRWITKPDAGGWPAGYTFTFRNRLRQAVADINFVLIFYGDDGEPVHSMLLQYRDPILAGLAKTVICDGLRNDFPYPGHQIRGLTKRAEVRVLDFRVIRE